MKTSFDYQIINSYQRLPYTPWYALAEFIDNSTQAYFNNKQILDKQFKEEKNSLTVRIYYNGKSIIVEDNSIGMNKEELNYALTIGQPPKVRKGRSKYGLGLKTAACWFGNLWRVKTKKINNLNEHSIVFDVKKVSKANLDLKHKQLGVKNPKEHYTIIEINKLHNELNSTQIKKIKDNLSSIYRLDFKYHKLKLYFNEELLSWENYEPKIHIDEKTKEPVRENFQFKMGKKKVKGWIGILAKGSRKNAGFSMIQADRVIIGWPNSYRPASLFGYQPGGSNDLANQRIVGEIKLEGFEVSHTKNEILWENNEETIFSDKLQKEVGDYRDYANTLRTEEKGVSSQMLSFSVQKINKELKSKEFKDTFRDLMEINEELLTESNKIIVEKVLKDKKPEVNIKIGTHNLKLYIDRDLSQNDPYLISQLKNHRQELIIVINRNHPHWEELSSYESVLNYLRHCAYDGISEWKAKLLSKQLKPDTIKWIKDRFLRLSFEIGRD